ncbi:hypothetical protein CcaverHIS002_0500380 [Cutaneotrichosporon cavernicola]|nr:hypothetical protein CcaverHIS002_0500380 [Cutaneotrichosporon cavernicola]
MSNKSESESSTESVWDDDNWTEGDFEIITSDNVRFRVPSFHLYSSRYSTPHRTADGQLSFPQRAQCCRLVVEGRLVTLYNLPFVKELAIFLDKYGCDQARSFMCSRIENAVLKGEIDAHAGFLVAANASNIPLCRLILVRQANHTWKRDKGRGSDELIAGMAGKNVWDSNYWPASTWNSGIPQAYLFALARAYGSCDMSSDNSLADEFEHYLNLITD